MSNEFYPSSAVRIAQTLGITGSFVLSGMQFMASYAAMPALLHASGLRPKPSSLPPQEVAKQWLAFFTRGKAAGQPGGIFSAACLAYVARAYYVASTKAGGEAIDGKWSAYALAAIFTFATGPFTRAFIARTNEALIDFAKRPATATGDAVAGVEEQDEANLKELIEKWTTFNYARALFPLFGGLIALWASL